MHVRVCVYVCMHVRMNCMFMLHVRPMEAMRRCPHAWYDVAATKYIEIKSTVCATQPTTTIHWMLRRMLCVYTYSLLPPTTTTYHCNYYYYNYHDKNY